MRKKTAFSGQRIVFVVRGSYVVCRTEDGGQVSYIVCRISPKIVNCAIADNEGFLGGGMDNLEGSPIVINCVFSGNTGYCGGRCSYGVV